MNNAEYDPLVKDYYQSKFLPFRVFSEMPDHLELLGDLKGKSVLDVACGEGFYTRLIRSCGASICVGVDVSPEMIRLAKAKEFENPIGIQYEVASVTSMGELISGGFDVVSTAFLFNCAQDQGELRGMFQEIYRNLKVGGRLCATVGDLGHRPTVDYSKYGMRTKIAEDLSEGAPYEITFLLPEGSFSITDYNHSLETYRMMSEEVGLQFEGLHPCSVTDAGIEKYGSEFWEQWLASPCIWRFSARKV